MVIRQSKTIHKALVRPMKWVSIRSKMKDPVDHVFSSGALAVVKECKIITLKYIGKNMQVKIILF